MATRSRKGCIDCKQAKIKCDEVHPFCGTCARRRRQCRGYATAGSTVGSSRSGVTSVGGASSSSSIGIARSQGDSSSLARSPGGLAARSPAAGRAAVARPPRGRVAPYPVGPAGRRSPLLLQGTDSSSSESGSEYRGAEDYQSPAAWTPPGVANTPPVSTDDLWDGTLTTTTTTTSGSSPNYVYPNPYPSSQRHRIVVGSSGQQSSGGQSGSRQRSPPSAATTRTALVLSHTILEAAASRQGYLSPLRGPSFIPLNEILAEDKPIIEIYFMRHPGEMVMSNDFFINEMNGAVISLLQQSPGAVGESLCAIGENYLKDTAGTALVSNRKTRLLHRVMRLLNQEGSSPELVLLLLLALCGAELTDPESDGKGETLSSLIENVALILEFHTRSGRELNFAARYFAKGVARQDLLLALSRMQRTRINPAIWLDNYAMTHADRLLGLTATMTPILCRLSALAEDVQKEELESPHLTVNPVLSESPDLTSFPMYGDFSTSSPDEDLLGQMHRRRADLAQRSETLKDQLVAWRPIRDSNLSLETSRRMILHATAWKSAALLYLYRLFHRPGTSAEADTTAQGMAYEILVNISGPAEDIKLSLWPLFMASCELEQPEDRETAIHLFDEICHARPIMTAKRTKAFCTDHIWPARDRGEVWDWMQLARNGPNAFMPA